MLPETQYWCVTLFCQCVKYSARSSDAKGMGFGECAWSLSRYQHPIPGEYSPQGARYGCIRKGSSSKTEVVRHGGSGRPGGFESSCLQAVRTRVEHHHLVSFMLSAFCSVGIRRVVRKRYAGSADECSRNNRGGKEYSIRK
jgi:hypothetical protein